MCASIVRRHHLDVECVIAAVDVVLDADVRELHLTPAIARQVVLQGPGPDLVDVAIRAAIAVIALAVPLLKEFLIVRLEFVLQDDAMDVRALVAQPLGLLEIRPVDFGIVLQLPRLLDAVVERLAVRRVGVTPAGFEQVTTLLGQRHSGRVPVKSNGLNEPRVAEMP